MQNLVYLEDVLGNYHDTKNPVQCLYVELAERKNPMVAVEIVYAVSLFYFGYKKAKYDYLEEGEMNRTQKLDKKPRYTQQQIMSFIRGQVPAPRSFSLACLVYLVAVVDSPGLAKVLGDMVGITFNRRAARDINITYKDIHGTLSRVNNIHLMPNRYRGAVQQVHHRKREGITPEL